MKLKFFYSSLFLFLSFVAKSQFNKNDAIIWLNAKMEEAKSVDIEDMMTFSQPIFSECDFNNKIWQAKFDLPEPRTLSTNTYSVSLSKLNPNEIQLHSHAGKFYYDVPTTNSLKIIPVYYFKPNETPYIITKQSTIRIGPFLENKSLEKRVKDVLIKLIKSCGGKDDTF